MPQLLPAIALFISTVMLMLGELGFLGVLMGERFIEISIQMQRASVRMPATPEWAALLSGAPSAIPVAVAFAGTRPRISFCYTWLQLAG
ncbi:MAG: hypothetical protein OXD46_11825 [Chloroflexi bacterium]|nr:hypothetical protein [Chloroflexota bacterium]